MIMRVKKTILPHSPGHAMLLGVGACLVFQLAAFIFTFSIGFPTTIGGISHDGYLEIARCLMTGHGYTFDPGGPPVLHRPPLYPILLTPIATMPVGWARVLLTLLQSLLVGGLASIAFIQARRWIGPQTAPLAALLVATNPWLCHMAKNPMPALLQAFLYGLCFLLATLWAAGQSRGAANVGQPAGRFRWSHAWLLGALGGLLILTHGTTPLSYVLLLAVGCGLSCWLRCPKQIPRFVLAGLLTVAIAAPWTYRNWIVLHRFVPVTGNAGMAYFSGAAHWDMIDLENQDHECILIRAGMDPAHTASVRFWGFTDPALEVEFNRRAKEDIRANPGSFILRAFYNSIEYYFPVIWYIARAITLESVSHWTYWFNPLAISAYFFVVWGMVGVAWRRTWRSPELRMAWCVSLLGITCYAMPYLPFLTFVGHSLYTFGTLPFLYTLAALSTMPKKVPRQEPVELVANEVSVA